MSEMDNQCEELLPRVCAVLADPNQVLSDDTCLEKILDWFRGLTAPDSPVLKINPCLILFISGVCKSKTAEPRVLSFALKLAGLLAAREEGFYVFKEENVLEDAFDFHGWSESCLWEDATVRSGWVHGLRSMAQHREALHFLFKNGLIEVVLHLQTDKSLFVASAANQLLAHILNLSESMTTIPSLEKGGYTDLAEEEHKRRSVSEWPEWADCVTKVMKHVEDSLMSSDPFRARQSLKLIAMSLAHCQPRVREMLWRRTEGAVELLFGKGENSVTQLFVEVLQAAARTPLFSQTSFSVAALIQTVLGMLTPVQAIPFAAGIIHVGTCPDNIKKKALGVILRPLAQVTSADQQQPLSDLIQDGGDQHASLEDLLHQKSSCIALLCLSLSSIAELAGKGFLSVEIPLQSVILSVITVLKVCVGMSVFSSPSTSVFRNLIGCSKVQKCALHALASLFQTSESSVIRSDVCLVLLEYLDSPDVNSTVLQKAYQVTFKWFSVCSEPPPQALFSSMKKRLCSIQWEVRDSSLEFLTGLTSHFHSNRSYCEMLLSSGVPDLAFTLLRDPESYVRASAIFALGQTALITKTAGSLTSGHVPQEDLATQFVDILAEDTEVFARRAVIKVFILWFTSPYPTEDLEEPLRAVLTLGSEDLDWEVKVHTLELARVLISQALPQFSHNACPYAVSCAARPSSENVTDSLRKLEHLKILTVLFMGLFDCDRPVAKSACSVLLSLKLFISENSSVSDNKVTCDLQGQSWVVDSLKKHLERLHIHDESRNSVDFVEVLLALDLEDMQQTLGQRSDHLQNSPHSLLEDILAASHVSEDNILDCY